MDAFFLKDVITQKEVRKTQWRKLKREKMEGLYETSN